MIDLFRHNPGLESRFHWIFDFHDYSSDDLVDIGKFAVKEMTHVFTPEAIEELRSDFSDGKNGREVRNIIEEIELAQTERTGKSTEYSLEFLRTLTAEDVLSARAHRATHTDSSIQTKSTSSVGVKYDPLELFQGAIKFAVQKQGGKE